MSKASAPWSADHTYTDGRCWWEFCRIHFMPTWDNGTLWHERYPLTQYRKPFDAPRTEWRTIIVHCGPAAFYPTRKTAKIPAPAVHPKPEGQRTW